MCTCRGCRLFYPDREQRPFTVKAAATAPAPASKFLPCEQNTRPAHNSNSPIRSLFFFSLSRLPAYSEYRVGIHTCKPVRMQRITTCACCCELTRLTTPAASRHPIHTAYTSHLDQTAHHIPQNAHPNTHTHATHGPHAARASLEPCLSLYLPPLPSSSLHTHCFNGSSP